MRLPLVDGVHISPRFPRPAACLGPRTHEHTLRAASPGSSSVPTYTQTHTSSLLQRPQHLVSTVTMSLDRGPSSRDSLEEKDAARPAGVAPMYYSTNDQGSTHANNNVVHKISTLGATAGTIKNVAADGDIILLPTPTDDANDPLNWSRAYKWYMTCVVCLGAFMSNLLAAVPVSRSFRQAGPLALHLLPLPTCTRQQR